MDRREMFKRLVALPLGVRVAAEVKPECESVLILESDYPVSQAHRDKISEILRKHMPNTRICLLAPGMRVTHLEKP